MRDTKCSPGRDCQPGADEDALEQHHGTAMVCARTLGLPVRGGGGEVTKAEARHEAADNELRQGERCRLEYGANDVDEGAELDSAFAAEFVAEPDAVERPEEAAEGVEGYDGALEARVMGFGGTSCGSGV